jgi:hypothetical protein
VDKSADTPPQRNLHDEDIEFFKTGVCSFIRGIAVHVLDDDMKDLVRGSLVTPLLHMLASQIYPYLLGAGLVVSVLLIMSGVTICLLLLGGSPRASGRLYLGQL